MLKNVAYLALFAAVLYWGFAAREHNIENRAAHADEAEQASTYSKLLDGGIYRYNPDGPHGPTLYYYALLCDKVCSAFSQADPKAGSPAGSEEISGGSSEVNPQAGAKAAPAKKPSDSLSIERLRHFAMSVCAAIFAAFWLLQGRLGLAAVLAGFACFWVSSIGSIYSVYFVHEIIFALSILLCAAAAWRFLNAPGKANALLFGLSAGLAQATKETAPLGLAAVFLAAAACCALDSALARNARAILSPKRLFSCAAVAAVGFALVFALFYSSFFSNPKGIADAFASYAHFAGKAASPEHSQGALYYLKLFGLEKIEGITFGELPLALLFCVSLAGAAFACLKNGRRPGGGAEKNSGALCALFFGLAAVFNIAILSLIPYKNPWLALSGVLLMSVASGWGAARALSAGPLPARIAGIVAVLVLLCWQIKLGDMSVKRFHSDPRNPYLYSHTVNDFKNLIARIDSCAKVSEYKNDIPVAFVTKNSPWPAPWFLRKYENAGFWSGGLPKNIEEFEIVACDAPFAEEAEKSLKSGDYIQEFFGLRKNLVLWVWIKKPLFEASLEQ